LASFSLNHTCIWFMLKSPEQTNAAVIEWLGVDGRIKLMARL
jgi:hypothetical protein